MQLTKLQNRYTLPADCDHDGRMHVLIDVHGQLIKLTRISIGAWADIVKNERDKLIGVPSVYAVYLGKMGEAIMMVQPTPNEDYRVAGYYTPMVKAF